MLIEYLKSISDKASVSDIKETFKELNLKIVFSDYSWDDINGLLSCLKNIHARDDFELILDVNGNIETVINICDDNTDVLKKHLAQEDVEELPVELNVKKTEKDGVSSIYLLNELENYIKSTSLINLTISLNRIFKENHVFEVQDNIQDFGSNTIKFTSFNANYCIENISNRVSRLNSINENSTQLIDGVSFLSDDFYLISRSQLEGINIFFDSMVMALSLAALSNAANLNSSDEISFKINGYKTLDVQALKVSSLPFESELLYKIVLWTFERGQYSDKLGLIRNILSLHVDSAGVVEINNQTWLAIQSNYEVYLKDNIQQYIEIKNKITDFIFNYNTKIYDLSDQFLNAFRGNLIAIISFILSVVIVNGFKDGGVKTIFSLEYLYIVISISVISVVWMIFTRYDLNDRAANTESNIKSILSRNYRNVLIKEEIDSYIDPAFSESKTYLSGQIRKYTIGWAFILVSFVAVFVIGGAMFLSSSNSISIIKGSLIEDVKSEDIDNKSLKIEIQKTTEETDKAKIKHKTNNKLKVKDNVNSKKS